MRRLLSAGLLAATLALGACGDKDPATTSAPSTPPPTPSPTASPNAVGQLPPAFVECMAARGFDVTSGDIHSAPPDVLQACFGTVHQGGG